MVWILKLDDSGYRAIEEELRRRLPAHGSEWSDHETSDPGIALVDLLDLLADVLVRRGDALPDPDFLRLAAILGMTPHPPRPARVELLVKARRGLSSAVHLEPGLQVSTPRRDVVFETVEPLLLGRRSRVKAIEGRTVHDERVGTSDGTPNQRFRLKYRPILPLARDLYDCGVGCGYALEAKVHVAGRAQRWRATPTLASSGPRARVYRLNPERGTVQFGDGRRGRVLEKGAVLKVSYRAGGGAKGNVAAGRLTRLLSPVDEISKVTNPRPAAGGTDAESMEEFRKRVPHEVRQRGRAVTCTDHAGPRRGSPTRRKRT